MVSKNALRAMLRRKAHISLRSGRGQGLSSSTGANRLSPCPLYLRFQACQWRSGRITLCARSGRRFVCHSWPLALALSRLALPGWLPRGPDIVELVLPLGLEWIVPRLRDILGKLDQLHLVHIARAIWKDCARF